MTRLRRLCVFCWRQLIGSRNKTNLQPVKLIASSNSTRTRGVWGLSWGRGKRCSRVCPPPPPTTSTPHLATIITLDIWAELHIDLMDRLRWMLSVYKTVFYFYSQQMSYLYLRFKDLNDLRHLPGCHLYLLSPQRLTYFDRFISPVVFLSRF